jgi:hypothetical protein
MITVLTSICLKVSNSLSQSLCNTDIHCAAERLWVERFILLGCLSLRMKALGSSDKSGHTYTLTPCHITEDLNLQQHCCENVQCGSVSFTLNEASFTQTDHLDICDKSEMFTRKLNCKLKWFISKDDKDA